VGTVAGVDSPGFAEIVALGGLLAAIGGFFYAGLQLRHAQRSARGTFLLDLEEMLRHHDKIHIKLEPGGEEDWKPAGPDDWAAVEAYMGVFERIQLLVEERILDLDTVDRLYSYRVLNIVNNEHIRKEKLVEKGQFWTDFRKLWHSLENCYFWKINAEYLAEAGGSSPGGVR
jgi:hypothetical protein